MPSTRLNMATRDAILTAVMSHAFNKKAQALTDDRSKFAHDVLDYVMNDFREAFDAAPEKWFPIAQSIRIVLNQSGTPFLMFNGAAVGGNRLQSKHVGDISYPDRDARRVPHHIYQSGAIARFDAEHNIHKRFDMLAAREKELTETVQRTAATTMASLKKVTTVEKLIDTWPEIAPFARPHITATGTAAPPAVPMIPVKDLNGALGLPISE